MAYRKRGIPALSIDAIRTAVAFDQHQIVLDSIEAVLRGIGLEVSGKTTTPERALRLVEERNPDLFVAGLETSPEASIDGIELLRRAAQCRPAMKLIALSSGRDEYAVDEAFAAGACAFIARSASPADVACAVRQAYEQSIHLPAHPGAEPHRALARGILTGRETEVLQLVSAGLKNGEVASTLVVTEQTVKFHLSNAYRKLGRRTERRRVAVRG